MLARPLLTALAGCLLVVAALMPIVPARSAEAQARTQPPIGEPTREQTGAPTAIVERVGGRVVDARDGRPVPRASLILQANPTQKITAETTADEDGRFRFETVPGGRYRLTAKAKGYLPAAYLQHGELSSAIVTGAGLPTGDLVLQLTPAGLIQGHVTDEAGDPVTHATVSLYRENPAVAMERVIRIHTLQTDDRGRYEFRGMAPGRYFLAASGIPWYAVHAVRDPEGSSVPYRTAVDPALDVAYPTLFYPGALGADGAKPIPIAGGEEVTADMQLIPLPAVTITLQRAPGAPPNGTFPTLTHSVFGEQEAVAVQGVVQDGTQTITGLPPGEYSVQQFGDGNRAPVTVQTVHVANGSVTVPYAADGPELATVSVHVQPLPPAALPAGLQINLRDLRRARRFASAKVEPSGEATFAHVPVGEYRPVLFRDGHVLALASVSVNGEAVKDRQIRVTGSQPITVAVVASGDPVLVTGIAEFAGKAAVGRVVILVPAGGDTSEDLFRRDQTDLDGGFTFGAVTPGDYIAVALEDGWEVRWTDPQVLGKYLPHGVPISVGPGSPHEVKVKEPVVVQPR